MLRTAKRLDLIPFSPTKNDVKDMQTAESVPLVVEPISRYYTSPVIVLDFQALYPSIIIAASLRSRYDARQLALKLLSNVTYGYTSASFSGQMPCVEIADSIVQTGRETLKRVFNFLICSQSLSSIQAIPDGEEKLYMATRTAYSFIWKALQCKELFK